MKAPDIKPNWSLALQDERAGQQLVQQAQQNTSVDSANLLKMFGAPTTQPTGPGLTLSTIAGGGASLTGAPAQQPSMAPGVGAGGFAAFIGRR